MTQISLIATLECVETWNRTENLLMIKKYYMLGEKSIENLYCNVKD